MAVGGSNWCADRTNADGFVDMSALLDLDAGFLDLNVGNLCDPTGQPTGAPSPASPPLPSDRPIIAGKPGAAPA